MAYCALSSLPCDQLVGGAQQCPGRRRDVAVCELTPSSPLSVGVFVIERATAGSAVWNVVAVPQLLSAMSLPQTPAAISTIVWPASIAHVHPHEVLQSRSCCTRNKEGNEFAALLAADSLFPRDLVYVGFFLR